jgi:hypothetical protein
MVHVRRLRNVGRDGEPFTPLRFGFSLNQEIRVAERAGRRLFHLSGHQPHSLKSGTLLVADRELRCGSNGFNEIDAAPSPSAGRMETSCIGRSGQTMTASRCRKTETGVMEAVVRLLRRF